MLAGDVGVEWSLDGGVILRLCGGLLIKMVF